VNSSGFLGPAMCGIDRKEERADIHIGLVEFAYDADKIIVQQEVGEDLCRNSLPP